MSQIKSGESDDYGSGDNEGQSRRLPTPKCIIKSSVLKPTNDLWNSFAPLLDLSKSTIYRLGSFGTCPRAVGKCPHFAICKYLLSHEQGPEEDIVRSEHSGTFKIDVGIPEGLQPSNTDFDGDWHKAHVIPYERFLKSLELCFMSMSLGNVAAVVRAVNDEMSRIDKKGSKITSDHGGGLCIVSSHMSNDPLKIGKKKDVYVADHFMFTYIVRDRNGPKLFAYRTVKENRPEPKGGASSNKKAKLGAGLWDKKCISEVVDDPVQHLQAAGVPFFATKDDFYSINNEVNLNYNSNSEICPINEAFFSKIEEEKANADKNDIDVKIIDSRMGNTFRVEVMEHLTNSFQLGRTSGIGRECEICAIKLNVNDLFVTTTTFIGDTQTVSYDRQYHYECFFQLVESIGYKPTAVDFTYANRCGKKDKDALIAKLAASRNPNTSKKFLQATLNF